MLRIKDYIFNENEILQISKGVQNTLSITLKSSDKLLKINNATFDDIEWDYGTPQETQKQMQKELCKSCYYRDTISNKLKELEEENKRLKENQSGFTLEEYTRILNDYQELQQRINKAIELIKEYYPTSTINYQDEKYEIIKVLKGSEE